MANNIPYKIPAFQESSFNCPFCQAFANQNWKMTSILQIGYFNLQDLWVSFCTHCNKYSIWHDEQMLYPDFKGIEPPNEDLNEEVKNDYNEAVSILQKSPRGSAALLRLAIQKLCKQLGGKGEDLNSDIGNLVRNGLPQKVQQSLDSLRVIGNESVHPGQLDLKDDTQTASSLFKLVNFIAEKMITEPKEIDAIYDKLPASKKEQIKKRDGGTDK